MKVNLTNNLTKTSIWQKNYKTLKSFQPLLYACTLQTWMLFSPSIKTFPFPLLFLFIHIGNSNKSTSRVEKMFKLTRTNMARLLLSSILVIIAVLTTTCSSTAAPILLDPLSPGNFSFHWYVRQSILNCMRMHRFFSRCCYILMSHLRIPLMFILRIAHKFVSYLWAFFFPFTSTESPLFAKHPSKCVCSVS